MNQIKLTIEQVVDGKVTQSRQFVTSEHDDADVVLDDYLAKCMIDVLDTEIRAQRMTLLGDEIDVFDIAPESEPDRPYRALTTSRLRGLIATAAEKILLNPELGEVSAILHNLNAEFDLRNEI